MPLAHFMMLHQGLERRFWGVAPGSVDNVCAPLLYLVGNQKAAGPRPLADGGHVERIVPIARLL